MIVGLEAVMWEALHDVARKKGASADDIVTDIANERGSQDLTAAIRNYVVEYYRKLALRALNDARR
jgi:predicted DNA-binding ribbon-helix-helix protein